VLANASISNFTTRRRGRGSPGWEIDGQRRIGAALGVVEQLVGSETRIGRMPFLKQLL